MLYPKNQTPELETRLFENPTSEYRCAPFWAWNAVLDPVELKRQIEVFKKMGMGGFHMHCRAGLATPYLGDEFMELIRTCVEKAKDEDMLAWLYDEDRWPSGFGGGIVTKNHAFREQYLLMTTVPYGEWDANTPKGDRQENGKLLACYDVVLDEQGNLERYRRCTAEEETEGTRWYAYAEIMGDSPRFNYQAYLDTLNPKAVEKFAEVTHERYAAVLGEDFGTTSPAIFTDEPQFKMKQSLSFATDTKDVTLPWTGDFPETFKETVGMDLLDAIPELFWELPDGELSAVRYHYHEHLAERFASAFADTLGKWCDDHNILLTGHMMEEPTLCSQTRALGDAMRSYRSFSLPGIDMLCDYREFTTAKQAQSAAHQYGRPGVLSELYGVTNWDFDFRGHKLQGDWQAAMGVTVRVPHLSWYSMGGTAKRDYPAAISYQSPWWDKYAYVENHFARINTALTRGKPHVRIGVIHPVESYWLLWGPNDSTHARREELDAHFQQVTAWLVEGLQDFNFICESLLPDQCKVPGAPLQVGEMAYDTIIVPDCITLRSTTLERLTAFQKAGGRLLFMGNVPTYVDAQPDTAPIRLAAASKVIDFTRYALMEALEDNRLLDIINENGVRVQDMTYQLRDDGEVHWLFLAHTYKPKNPDICPGEKCRVKLRGSWSCKVYDTMTGDIRPLPVEYVGEDTFFSTTFYPYDSLLLRLEAGVVPYSAQKTETASFTPIVMGKVPVTLSQPNVLVLDMPEYALDDQPYRPSEEMLRIDKQIRSEIGYPLRGGNLAQPWVIPDDGQYEHTVRLRFSIDSEIALDTVTLAAERMNKLQVLWNGTDVPVHCDGWFTDKSISTTVLHGLKEGRNVLEIFMNMGKREGLENCFLLGDFGVRVAGDTAVITKPVRELAFGDWTVQGLPFYAGNVAYHLDAEIPENAVLEAAIFRNPVLSVALDDEEKGLIAYAPYRLPLGNTAGKHAIDITAYGNCVNTFGTLHCSDRTLTWFGPPAWETEGIAFSRSYQLKQTGILSSPRIGK